MHDLFAVKTLISLATKRPIDEIFIYWPLDPLESVLQDIKQVARGIFLVIGFDRPDEEIYVELDRWLQQQDSAYDVFLLNEDFLAPRKQTLALRCITLLHINHDTLSNLSWLWNYQHRIKRDFVTVHSQDRWLSLTRCIRPWRAYAKKHWIDRWPQHFVYSFGTDCFHGNFEFYGQIPNAPSYVDNALNLFSLSDLYNTTCGSIVNETGAATSYSEKTFHAILALHPVLIIGEPGLVAYLRDQGFDMFDDILDHSYDQIKHHTQRIDALFRDNETIIQRGIDRDHLRERLLHNRQHVWQYYQDRMNQFEKHLINNLKGSRS
jgi:hypothetical protein